MTNTIEQFNLKHLALQKLRPTGAYTLYEDGTLDWDDTNETEKPTEEELEAKIQQILAERPLKQLRKERDKRIAETDWWAGSDRTMTQEQIDYRQALRDITNTYTSLDDVVWPVKP